MTANLIQFGNLIGTIPLASLDHNFSAVSNNVNTANTAATVTANAQPNITSVGTLNALNVTGNLVAGNIGTAGNITGNYFIGKVSTTGNIAGNYFIGNGALLTGISAGGTNYSNANVAAYLPTYSGNLTAGNAVIGNVGIRGNGIYDINGIVIENADLTHGATAALILPTNGNPAAIQLNNIYGNVVLQAGFNGTITNTILVDNAGNLSVSGNIRAAGVIRASGNVQGNYFIGNGSALTGITASANTGNIAFSGNNIYNTQGAGEGILISPNAGGGLDGEIYLPYKEETANLTITNYNANINLAIQGSHEWQFDTTGNLSLPGSLISNGASPAPVLQNFTFDAERGMISSLGQSFDISAKQSDTTGKGYNLSLAAGSGVANAGGNVNIVAGFGSGAANGNITLASGPNTWNFDNAGNLTLPGNTFAVNYANGSPVIISGGGGTYGNANVAAYLPTYGGNVDAQQVSNASAINIASEGTVQLQYDPSGVYNLYDVANGSWAFLDANGFTYQSNTTGNIGSATIDNLGNISASGNVTAANFTTTGPQGNITGANVISATTVTAAGNVYANNVHASYYTNVSANSIMYVDSLGRLNGDAAGLSTDGNGSLSAYGNIQTAGYFIGDGSLLTNIPGGGNSSSLANSTARLTLGTDGTLLVTSNGTPTNFVVNTTTTDIDLRTASGTGLLTQGNAANITGEGNVTLTSHSHNWTFNPQGTLVFPNGIGMDTSGPDLLTFGVANATIGTTAFGEAGAISWEFQGPGANGNTSYGAVTLSKDTSFGGEAPQFRIDLINDQDNVANNKVWFFDASGNMRLPGNTFAVNYANGTQVSLGGGGSANTGNITFSNSTISTNELNANINITLDTGNAADYQAVYMSVANDANGLGYAGLEWTSNTTATFAESANATFVWVDPNGAHIEIVDDVGNVLQWDFNAGAGSTGFPGPISTGSTVGNPNFLGETTFNGNIALQIPGSGLTVATRIPFLAYGNGQLGGSANLAFTASSNTFSTYNVSAGGNIRANGTATFGGNLTLTAGDINTGDGNIHGNFFYGNGSLLTGVTATANTGNVTFSNQTVIGTGDIYGGGGLYLAQGPDSVANLQYFRVRGGDYPTHIHFDTGNNDYYDQYFGSDTKFVKLEPGVNGNVVIGTYNSGFINWTFDSAGTLTIPGNIAARGNVVALTNENGNPGGPGVATITANTGSNPNETNIQVGWTVTGNNLVGVTTVTAINDLGGGVLEFVTDTGVTDPIWYGDVYTFTQPSPVWNFSNSSSLTLPTIDLGAGLNEQTTIQSQRKIIPPYRWSVEIANTTPTVVYTAVNNATTSMKVTMQIQHTGLGMELFEVFATITGSDTYYSVNNRVAPPTIADSTVVVGLGPLNAMKITVTINSGAAFSWVTYDAVEFGIPQD